MASDARFVIDMHISSLYRGIILQLGRSVFNKIYNLPCSISLIETTFSDITNQNAILYDTENCLT